MTGTRKDTVAAMLLLLSVSYSTHFSSADLSLSKANITRHISGHKLPGPAFMEIVEETTCSNSIVRLTCRSLKAIIFVLEAEYTRNVTDACESEPRSVASTIRQNVKKSINSISINGEKWILRGNYFEDEETTSNRIDVRSSLNRRCSGHHHCRFLMSTDHPGKAAWQPANLRIKYACIPDMTVHKYCNSHLHIRGNDAGYVKSPGYPLYYFGSDTCGWIFKSPPGQKIMLTFHDLNIRGRESDGSCIDIIRVRDSGDTLFESCATVAGVKVISKTNAVSLDLVAADVIYPARGFFLEYQVLGCPDVPAPEGSLLARRTIESRTFLCRSGMVFPDIKKKARKILCKNGDWSVKVETLPGCVASWAIILKSESENEHLSSLSGGSAGFRLGREYESAEATSYSAVTSTNMDPTGQPAMIKQADYVVDVILPSVLIALLFVGNAVIVYIIFQYRKRKSTSTVSQGEEVGLKSTNAPCNAPQV